MLMHYIMVHFLPMWFATGGMLVVFTFMDAMKTVSYKLKIIGELALAISAIILAFLCTRVFITPTEGLTEAFMITFCFCISTYTTYKRFYLPLLINTIIGIICIYIFDVM